MEFLNVKFLNNTVLDYIIFTACLISGCLAVKLINRLVIKRLVSRISSTNPAADTLLGAGIKNYLLPAAYLGVLYLCTKLLNISESWLAIINTAVLAIAVVLLALFVSSLAICIISSQLAKKSDGNTLALKWISGIAKAVIWIIAFILFLDNIGVKITSLITGLGIGGIAIAFAAQAVLADIFCFFTILFDRPFEVGDLISIGELTGTVEHIGIKTTRIRSINGEQLIFSNTDLSNSRISNFHALEQRRVLFTLMFPNSTSNATLKEIPAIIERVINSVPGTRFSRAHFSEFGAYSLKFEAAYFVTTGDYNKYMDIKQEVNLNIKAEFEAQGIEFAYPTQTLVVANAEAIGTICKNG